MTKFIIHIGTPRTGTTVLQKHIFPELKNTLALCKRPFKPSYGNPETITRTFTQKNLKEYSTEERADLFENSIMAGTLGNKHEERARTICLLEGLSQQDQISQVLISSELLCDNNASLNGNSRHNNGENKKFYIYSLIELFRKAGIKPMIALCLREPIEYLTSKYLRTVIQRESQHQRFIQPSEFIAKQILLEEELAGSSVITQACHKSFVTQLSHISEVNHFGFRDLIKSHDVFQLFQLENEKKIDFGIFPRENDLQFKPEFRGQVKAEIKSTLNKLEYERIIEDDKLYE